MPSSNGGAATILAVDDDPTIRTLLEQALSRQGYRVLTAEDGPAALSAIVQAEPDVVLLDVMMPGMDGFELCRRLKESPATRFIPVVLVTGLGAREHRLAGLEAGADEFIAKPFDLAELRARVRSLVRLKRNTDELESAESLLTSLGLAIEARDPYTVGHCQRLAVYATRLGRHLGLGADDLQALERGGFLHDVGKIGVPDAVLFKPGPLTPAEFAIMKEHVLIGDRLCAGLRSLRLIRPIVRHHHERFDGSGYPDGLRGDAIPLLAQVLGIVDAYDAITTARPYKAAMPPAHACDELAAETVKGWRRADLVEALLHLIERGEIAGLGETADP